MVRNNDRLRPLTHPVFWGALVLLLVNDHLLKGAGLVPAELTGKLSDFAGLIVAPVLAAAMLGVRTPRGRVLAFAVATLPFVVINVSPAAAQLFETLGASLSYRAWSDPSDLVALAMLPIAWRISAPRPSTSSAHAPLQLAGLMLGAFACMATSVAPPDWITNGYFVNHTGGEVTVRVSWLEAPIDCELVRPDPQRALSELAFGNPTAVRLDANETLPLDRSEAASAVAGASIVAGRERCEAVIVRGDGLPPQLLFWELDGAHTVALMLADDDDAPPGRASLGRDVGGNLAITGDARITSAPLLDRVEAGACPADDALPLEWAVTAGPEESWAGGILIERRLHPDGCIGIRFEEERGDLRDATFCIPEWAFPWEVGEWISLDFEFEGYLTVSGDTRSNDYRNLAIGSTTDETFEIGDISARVDALDCDGERSACGRFSVPAVLSLDGLEAPLRPGDTVELGEAKFHLASARRIGVEPLFCSPDSGQFGHHASWLRLRGGRAYPTIIDGGTER